LRLAAYKGPFNTSTRLFVAGLVLQKVALLQRPHPATGDAGAKHSIAIAVPLAAAASHCAATGGRVVCTLRRECWELGVECQFIAAAIHVPRTHARTISLTSTARTRACAGTSRLRARESYIAIVSKRGSVLANRELATREGGRGHAQASGLHSRIQHAARRDGHRRRVVVLDLQLSEVPQRRIYTNTQF
jgi:hypothetical protein